MAKKQRAQHQTVQMLMSDGSMEIGSATKVGSQLISDVLNGVAMPGREMPTPTFIHKELNRAPHKSDGVHFETENPIAVERDSQFLQVDAWSMWDGARLDLDSEKDGQRRLENILKGMACVVATIYLIFSMSMFSVLNNSNSTQQTTEQNQSSQPAPTPTPVAPIIPRVGGG